MIPILPREWLDEFTREHPVQALAIVLFGICMLGFALGLVIFK